MAVSQLRRITPVALTVLVMFIGLSRADDEEERAKCLTLYFTDALKIKSAEEMCPLAERLLRCQLQHTDVNTISETDIRDLEDKLSSVLSQNGVQCSIDIRGIVEDSKNSAPSAKHGPREWLALIFSAVFCLFAQRFM